MRPSSSDSSKFRQVFVSNGYALNFPFEPKIVIDAGAHIGLFTFLYNNVYLTQL